MAQVNKAGFTGSPFEDLSKPINLLSNPQSTTAQQNLISDTPFPQPPSSAIDSQHPCRWGSKRTSTDAGFSHTTEAHDAKMSQSHIPEMMHFRPSATGTTRKKGMEDVKSRLSKIQRESTMHERVHHHLLGPSANAPLIVNSRTSLVTQTSAPLFSKALPLAVLTTDQCTSACCSADVSPRVNQLRAAKPSDSVQPKSKTAANASAFIILLARAKRY
ncbi:hypothetical protein PSTG_08668 [Puccinia striiformis f. sp. tritici PST-78]|uniref:Uncharacterized protein n=1 Tax=Puccinia striiformis f. sp. tritici PST-78 TaxID=1165861 RepID=A0A0L0VFH4_9BASI|nr:hypothetical protein PSTG_08668 [Puccinia striiformis f. sp. tritici PST-78]